MVDVPFSIEQMLINGVGLAAFEADDFYVTWYLHLLTARDPR